MLNNPFRHAIAYDMGGGGGSTGTQVVQQNSEPWSGLENYLKGTGNIITNPEDINGLYEFAHQIGNTPQQFYPGQTFAGLSPEQQMALQAQAGRAIAGSPLVSGAQGQLNQTIGGNYLGGSQQVNQAINPFLQGQNQGDPTAQGALNAITSGQTAGGNPLAQGTFSNIASGGLTGNNPLANQQYAQTVAGQYAGGDPLARSTYANIAQDPNLSINPIAQDIFGQAAQGQIRGGNPLGLGALESTARGDLINQNPYLEDVIQRSIQDVQANTIGPYAGAGRYGSGAFANALKDAAMGTAANLRYQNYGQERQNQLGAAQTLLNQGNIDLSQQLGAAGQLQGLTGAGLNARLGAAGGLQGQFAQGRGEQLQGAGALAGLGQQNLQNRIAGAGALQAQNAQDLSSILSGAGQLSSNYFGNNANTLSAANLAQGAYDQERRNQLNATQLAPALANQDYFDAQQLAAVGDVYRNLTQQGIDENMARFNFGQMEPYNRASMYASLLQPGLGFGSTTSTSTGTMPGSSGVANLLGGAASGAGLGGMLAVAGMNPYLAAGLGGLGFLGSVFG